MGFAIAGDSGERLSDGYYNPLVQLIRSYQPLGQAVNKSAHFA